MAADAVGEDLRTALAERRHVDAVGVGDRCRQFRGVDSELTDRLGRNGIRSLGTTPGNDAPALDARALERRRELTLLGVAHRELCIGREEEVRRFMVGKVMRHIGHAGLLVAAQQSAERIARLDAVLDEVCAGVERKHRGTLVVDDATAEQPALAAFHLEGIGVPARAGRNHIDMADRGDLLVGLAGDIGHTHVARGVRRLVAELFRDAERAVEGGTCVLAEGRTRLRVVVVGQRRMAHQRLDIIQHIRPHLVDIGVDLGLRLLIHCNLQYGDRFQTHGFSLANIDVEKRRKFVNRMGDGVGASLLVLSGYRPARVDADRRHSHGVRALDIVATISHHNGFRRIDIEHLERIPDGIGFHAATLCGIHAYHSLELRQTELGYHGLRLPLSTRRGNRQTLSARNERVE